MPVLFTVVTENESNIGPSAKNPSSIEICVKDDGSFNIFLDGSGDTNIYTATGLAVGVQPVET